MAAPQSFRSAFNGFNREDVVHYIEYLGAKHTAQLNQLRSEAEFLKSKLSQAENAPAVEPEMESQLQQVRAENAELVAQLEALKQEKETLTALLTEAEAEKDAALAESSRLQGEIAAALAEVQQARTERDNALCQLQDQQSHAEAELEAYRRAERTERLARERAEQMYRQANGALADAAVKVDDAAGQIGDLTDKCLSQLELLRTAVTGSKQALQDAAATMYAIRPQGEE